MKKLLFFTIVLSSIISCKKTPPASTTTTIPASTQSNYYIRYTINGITDTSSFEELQYNVGGSLTDMCGLSNYYSSNPSSTQNFSTPNFGGDLMLKLPTDSTLIASVLGGKYLMLNGFNMPSHYPYSELFQLVFKINNNSAQYLSMQETSTATFYNKVISATYKGIKSNLNCSYDLTGMFMCRVQNVNNASDIKNVTGYYKINIIVRRR